MKRSALIAASVLLFSCTTPALVDPHFVLDPPNDSLRGKTPNDDRPLSDCNPLKKPDGSIEYRCVVHFFPEYDALLNKIAKLQSDLKACQQGRR
jgi:hypothetical protein